jgi:hypothetical protein
LQVAHALGQGFHVAQTLVHLLQTLGHLFEAFAQPRFQGGLQFFIHGLAHLIELGGIGFLQLLQLLVQGVAHLGHAPGIALAERQQLGAQSVAQVFLQQAQLLGLSLLKLRQIE